jgi:hypothetical protein
MNIAAVARMVGQAMSARGSVREFKLARTENDRLRMVQAVVTGLSVALTVAIIVRELRQEKTQSRVINLEEHQ